MCSARWNQETNAPRRSGHKRERLIKEDRSAATYVNSLVAAYDAICDAEQSPS